MNAQLTQELNRTRLDDLRRRAAKARLARQARRRPGGQEANGTQRPHYR